MDCSQGLCNSLAPEMENLSIPTAFGVLLCCSILASFLSGINSLQTIVYYRIYSEDRKSLKALVAAMCLCDLVHTGFVWAGMWFYFIQAFGDVRSTNAVGIFLPGVTLSASISMAVVHCFHIRGIFHLSGRNYWIAASLSLLVACRLGGSAAVTTELIRLRDFLLFKTLFDALVTIGLPLASAVDLLIMTLKLVLLHKGRRQIAGEGVAIRRGTKNVIDQLIIYTLEAGSLTAFGIVLCTILWFATPKSLNFLGIFFVIPKLYVNSLMGSLNIRHRLRSMTDNQTAEFTTIPPLSMVPESLNSSRKSN
ncbi:hypothetical protein JOM56_014593 [Amanita muscaria]